MGRRSLVLNRGLVVGRGGSGWLGGFEPCTRLTCTPSLLAASFRSTMWFGAFWWVVGVGLVQVSTGVFWRYAKLLNLAVSRRAYPMPLATPLLPTTLGSPEADRQTSS